MKTGSVIAHGKDILVLLFCHPSIPADIFMQKRNYIILIRMTIGHSINFLLRVCDLYDELGGEFHVYLNECFAISFERIMNVKCVYVVQHVNLSK